MDLCTEENVFSVAVCVGGRGEGRGGEGRDFSNRSCLALLQPSKRSLLGLDANVATAFPLLPTPHPSPLTTVSPPPTPTLLPLVFSHSLSRSLCQTAWALWVICVAKLEENTLTGELLRMLSSRCVLP